tara:strand:- start:218 stop:364 length:147 start_codon:yes stop_codon:yes gene_type:complete
MDIITPNLPSPKITTPLKKQKKKKQKKVVKYLDQLFNEEFIQKYFNEK